MSYFGPRPSATFGARFLAKYVWYINGLAARNAAEFVLFLDWTFFPREETLLPRRAKQDDYADPHFSLRRIDSIIKVITKVITTVDQFFVMVKSFSRGRGNETRSIMVEENNCQSPRFPSSLPSLFHWNLFKLICPQNAYVKSPCVGRIFLDLSFWESEHVTMFTKCRKQGHGANSKDNSSDNLFC